MTAKPLIVTLQLDENSARFFDDMRARYFPPDLNHLKSHLTLFHNLPGELLQDVIGAIARLAAATPPFKMSVGGLMKLGRGVAYKITSERLERIRAQIAEVFKDRLSRQDREKFRPHITIQNKVSPAEAAGLFDHLSDEFESFDVGAEGVQLWHYEGGPWSPVAAIPFQGERS
ncbi:MAG: 2'-5' RNA ligase family protein [Parvularculaceae bacterium]